MKHSLRLVFGIIFCILFAVSALVLALQMMDNIYVFRSPLHDTPPIPGRSLGEATARRVVFVLVDGLRYDTSLKEEVMPVLNGLRSQSASAEMVSKPPTFSTPGYGVLLTGAWPYLSDAPAFNVGYEDTPVLTQDNLFSAAKRQGLKTAVSGYYWFEKLIPQDALDTSFFTPGEDNAADRAVMDAALPWLDQEEYQFILIHLDQVDYAGHHEGGARDPNWDAAAARADAMLGEILAELDLTQDVLFVCSDHGHIDRGGHGGNDTDTLSEPFLLAGVNVIAGNYGEVEMVDVAPTLAVILGTNLPASSQGRVLTEMLNLPDAVLQNLPEETARQQSKLLTAYVAAIGQKINVEDSVMDAQRDVADYQKTLNEARMVRLLRERLLRFAMGAVLLVAGLFLLKRWPPAGLWWMLVGVVLYSLLFHMYYLVFGMNTYSYSAVPGETELIGGNGLAALIALFLTGFMLGWRNWVNNGAMYAAQRYLQFTLVLILLTAIPFYSHVLWSGLFATWTLPAINLHFLALLSLIQILFLGVGGLILMSVAAYMARRIQYKQRAKTIA
ncbi:MAG: hypothetical protein CVU39_22020 [Chloroflexi bacterium HGW-Chloroflexi-10]|nr:MAG: hypothetical protein CVU39_22020 [Chloroflexi bacterium HGW-Chloroflexi-10]